jgi:hypothetical protein
MHVGFAGYLMENTRFAEELFTHPILLKDNSKIPGKVDY